MDNEPVNLCEAHQGIRYLGMASAHLTEPNHVLLAGTGGRDCITCSMCYIRLLEARKYNTNITIESDAARQALSELSRTHSKLQEDLRWARKCLRIGIAHHSREGVSWRALRVLTGRSTLFLLWCTLVVRSSDYANLPDTVRRIEVLKARRDMVRAQLRQTQIPGR